MRATLLHPPGRDFHYRSRWIARSNAESGQLGTVADSVIRSGRACRHLLAERSETR